MTEKEKNTKRRRKIALALGITALAVTLALGATFAWQSINQNVLNENTGKANPGGRLHDDFNGTNKDIYVENFGDDPLVVRVQLKEFMELGRDAGQPDHEFAKSRTSVVEGTSYGDINTWPVYKFGNTGGVHQYLNYVWGGEKDYMPTFNKNKDSLDADVNGTYVGSGNTYNPKHFDDYVTYKVGGGTEGNTDIGSKTDNAIYDADENKIEEYDQYGYGTLTKRENLGGKHGVEGQDWIQKEETHTAVNTRPEDASSDTTVISMQQWLEGCQETNNIPKATGRFWIYDTDGWAYWGEVLKPHQSTGLLLNEVQMANKPDDNWYYGIDVTGQFVTLNDLGNDNNAQKTGFYDTTLGRSVPTADAEALFEVLQATSRQTPANTAPLSQQIKDDVQATPQTGVADPEKFVTIDGTDFYVLRVDEDTNHALLFQRYVTEPMAFGETGAWETSALRAYLNSEWLDAHPTLRNAADTLAIKTKVLNEDRYAITNDKVFCLSEADMFDASEYSYGWETKEDDYTFPEWKNSNTNIISQLLPFSYKIDNMPYPFWSRSPSHLYNPRGEVSAFNPVNNNHYYVQNAAFAPSTSWVGIRPAVWIDLTKIDTPNA